MLAIWVTYFICIMGPSPSESVLHFHTLAAQAVCLRVDDRSQLDSESPSPRCRDPFYARIYIRCRTSRLSSLQISPLGRGQPTSSLFFFTRLDRNRNSSFVQVTSEPERDRSKRRKRRQASAVAYHKPSVRIIGWLKT
jgi:hypothetical protein